MRSISHHIMPLVMKRIGGGHTHANTHTYTHTHIHAHTGDLHRIDFKKPGVPLPGLKRDEEKEVELA